jgi:two-component system sensor histidine kinase DesK
VKSVAVSLGCAAQRNASVLFWVPVLLLAPVLGLHGSAGEVALQLLLIVVVAASAVIAALTSTPAGPRRTPYAALGLLTSATVVGAATQGSAWLPTWLLLAITVPVVLRGWWPALAIPLVAAGSMAASWRAEGSGERMWSQGFVVLLSGAATMAFVRLIETIDELRRTREELARTAVARERERFSRDLHDLLGHTLSVMVVKSQAVRRLVERDPAAAAGHAADIERVGREALVEVREAVDAMRALSLAEELDGARRALRAAGIRAEVGDSAGPIPAEADQAFAWVVREGVTNVLRHSAVRGGHLSARAARRRARWRRSRRRTGAHGRRRRGMRGRRRAAGESDGRRGADFSGTGVDGSRWLGGHAAPAGRPGRTAQAPGRGRRTARRRSGR